MAGNGALNVIISAIDRVSGPIKSINKALRGPAKAMADIGKAGAGLADNLSKAFKPMAVLAGGGGIAAIGAGIGGVIKTSAEFEKFQTVLETIEGSSDKAKSSMAWVTAFAAKTPYELAGVTDSFVKLKAYGIDPQKGALESAGNAAAAMGKNLDQAVEALADAMTGENERLKEFGITTKIAGDKITYNWQENGKSMVAVANKNKKKQIEAVIEGIWNRRFGGAMDKLSKTWTGMWSNLQDSITQFKSDIGSAGLFDYFKAKLSEVLEFTQSPAFKDLALTISANLVVALMQLEEKLKSIDWAQVWEDVKNFATGVSNAVDSIGGWGNALIALAVIMNASTIVSILSLVGAILHIIPAIALAFGVGMLPVTVAILGIAALVALLMAHWDVVGPWFWTLWGGLKDTVVGFVRWIGAFLTGDGAGATEAARQMFSGIGTVVTSVFKGIGAVIYGFVAWVGSFFGIDMAAVVNKGFDIWRGLGPFFKELWGGVIKLFDDGWAHIKPIIDMMSTGMKTIKESISTAQTAVQNTAGGAWDSVFGGSHPASPGANAGGVQAPFSDAVTRGAASVQSQLGGLPAAGSSTAPGGPRPGPTVLAAAAQKAEVGGTIKIDIGGAPQGTRVTTDSASSGIQFRPEVGYRNSALGFNF
jgi:hypothetical protein